MKSSVNYIIKVTIILSLIVVIIKIILEYRKTSKIVNKCRKFLSNMIYMVIIIVFELKL